MNIENLMFPAHEVVELPAPREERRKVGHYDWVIVVRMKRGEETGRHPTYLEIMEFLTWGERFRLSVEELASRARVSVRQILRWKAKLVELGLWPEAA